MFPHDYFGGGYFAQDFFGPAETVTPPAPRRRGAIYFPPPVPAPQSVLVLNGDDDFWMTLT